MKLTAAKEEEEERRLLSECCPFSHRCGICVYLRFRIENIIFLPLKLVFGDHPGEEEQRGDMNTCAPSNSFSVLSSAFLVAGWLMVTISIQRCKKKSSCGHVDCSFHELPIILKHHKITNPHFMKCVQWCKSNKKAEKSILSCISAWRHTGATRATSKVCWPASHIAVYIHVRPDSCNIRTKEILLLCVVCWVTLTFNHQNLVHSYIQIQGKSLKVFTGTE